MARIAVTSDYYSILGVTPAAEDVVIRAAYRALIRHYHPDTNRDPEAQERVRAINQAFAVLRDPARRAEYDASRAGTDLRILEEFPLQRQPPAMRGLGIASAAVALALVAALWVLPQPPPPGGGTTVAPTVRQAPAAKPRPIEELEPESARLAKLRGEPKLAPPVPDLAMPVEQAAPAEASLEPAIPLPPPAVRVAAASVRRPVAPRPRPLALSAASSSTKKPEANPLPEPSADCRPGGTVGVSVGCKNERLVALDRMAAGFFSQSMAHADAAKKALLLTSHTRSAATRSACRSDSCVGDAYLRQMREISAIMEGHAPPEQ